MTTTRTPISAIWRRRYRAAQEGFRFDDSLMPNPCGDSGVYNELCSLRDKLYGQIFLANSKRDRDRENKLRNLEAFIGNLIAALPQLLERGVHGCVLVPLNRNAYSGKPMSQTHISKILRFFEEQRYIHVRNGYRDPKTGKGKVTRMMPRKRFWKLLRDSVARTHIEKYLARRLDTPIILRDAKKRPIEFNQTKFTRELAGKINFINDINSSFKIDYVATSDEERYPINPFIYAVFNNSSWKSGGRFYGSRYSHINMPKLRRQSILINNEPIVELDYSALHIHLLYAKAKQPPPAGDPYVDVCGEPRLRPILKKILLRLLNDKGSEADVIRRMNRDLSERRKGLKRKSHEFNKRKSICKKNQKLLDRYDVTIEQLVKSFKKMHGPIAEFFHCGTWEELQNVDSKIALEVMTWFAKRERPCLPRHDSFITQERYRDDLKAEMERAYQKITKRLFGAESTIQVSKTL